MRKKFFRSTAVIMSLVLTATSFNAIPVKAESDTEAGNEQLMDADGDGLMDYLEEYFETDKTQADTDGDGLSDYWEIMKFKTDPLKADTDGNGVSDGEEDGDNDGGHIRLLLITLLWRLCPELFQNGHVYTSRPPLYKITKGKIEKYAYSDEERDKIFEELGGETAGYYTYKAARSRNATASYHPSIEEHAAYVPELLVIESKEITVIGVLVIGVIPLLMLGAGLLRIYLRKKRGRKTAV